MLRSCYTTQAQFLRGSPRVSTIKWFFTDPEAPFLPYPSAVNSLNWVDHRDWLDGAGHTGEVPTAPRRWYNGAPPAGFTGAGPAPWGTEADFRLGGLMPLTPVVPGPDGLPVCCHECTWFGTPYGDQIPIVAAGFTDGIWPLSLANGTWTLGPNVDGSCSNSLILPGGDFSVTLDQPSAGVLIVEFLWTSAGTGIGITYSTTVPLPIPAGTYTLNVVGTPDPTWGTWPATITVQVSGPCDEEALELLTEGSLLPITTETGYPLETS